MTRMTCFDVSISARVWAIFPIAIFDCVLDRKGRGLGARAFIQNLLLPSHPLLISIRLPLLSPYLQRDPT